jgi:hypothetical protein
VACLINSDGAGYVAVIEKTPLIPGISANLAGKDGADAKPYQETQVRKALQAVDEMRGRQQP